jgi:hypothetical protein
LRYVVSFCSCFIPAVNLHANSRHASIDPATRAARGLPEDLIRLCVGIEDASDLIEDLEFALLEAGAITFNTTENKMARAPLSMHSALNEAAQKLTNMDSSSEPSEWLVSAPGKIILFGEHAVVHGVVRLPFGEAGLPFYPLSVDRNSSFG